MAARGRGRLVGRTSPPGWYRIDPVGHRRFVGATGGGDVFDSSPGAPAHPSFGHLVSHCGMGWSFDDLLGVVGAAPEDAVVFGRGTFEFGQPLRVGGTYDVRSTITQVDPRHGRRVGTFDAITVTHELWPTGGGPQITTTETYVVPPLAAGYRDPVNQGPSNLAYAFTAIAGWRGDLQDLRHVDFTFHATVTEGDRPEVQLSEQGTDVLADLVVANDVRALSCRCTFA